MTEKEKLEHQLASNLDAQFAKLQMMYGAKESQLTILSNQLEILQEQEQEIKTKIANCEMF